MEKKKVVFGFLGTKLDQGFEEKRWATWRPTISLFANEEFKADALELFITNSQQDPLARQIQKDIQTMRPDVSVTIRRLPIADPWNFQESFGALHDFAKGYAFREDVDYFVHLTTGTHVFQICLFLLTESRYFPARFVETFSHGAQEQWRGRVETIDLNIAAYDQLSSRFKHEQDEQVSLLKNGIATRNAAFNKLISQVETVSLRSVAPILLTGPTGAGKSQLASRIYALKKQRRQLSGAFIEVNCATLRGDNALSTLFGHKKGAFTGASGDRAGLLKAADQGLLFLDEIGEMGLDEQAMLLRALEEKRFCPLGSDKEVFSDFQLIAGTNQDLHKAVAEGRFREDLLARINLWSFKLPALRERPEDIEPNIEHEIGRASRLLGLNVSFNKEARETYQAFAERAAWPGNFRDLSASIERMATLADGGRIVLTDVKQEMDRLSVKSSLSQPIAQERGYPTLEKLGLVPASADHFDLVQLEAVVSVVIESATLAEAGRTLFAASIAAKSSSNDSDRLKKYLAKWGLTFNAIHQKAKIPLMEQ